MRPVHIRSLQSRCGMLTVSVGSSPTLHLQDRIVAQPGRVFRAVTVPCPEMGRRYPVIERSWVQIPPFLSEPPGQQSPSLAGLG
ncbi:hypothetical protein ACFPRG_22745 [Deinococcus cellulosilyticus]